MNEVSWFSFHLMRLQLLRTCPLFKSIKKGGFQLKVSLKTRLDAEFSWETWTHWL